MPEPSVDIVMVEDTLYPVTRNQTISILTDQQATLQVKGKNSNGFVSLQPNPLAMGGFDFKGLEGQFVIRNVSGGNQTTFTRTKSPSA